MALEAQPTCISRYHSFINKSETAAVLTEDWGELLDLNAMVNYYTHCFSLSFLTNISIALLSISCMLHVLPTLCKLRSVHYAFHTPTHPSHATLRDLCPEFRLHKLLCYSYKQRNKQTQTM